MTTKLLAEKIQKMLYGGLVRDDANITVRQIMLAIQVERDFVVRDYAADLSSVEKPLEDSMFTRFESVPVLWDDTRKHPYIEIPYGYLSLPFDRGLRIIPVSGPNLFRRVHNNYGSMNPDLLNLDGYRIPWCTSPVRSGSLRKVVFPASANGFTDIVDVDAIIGDSTQLPLAEVGVPDGLISIVEARVMSKLQRVVIDKANDGRDQA